MNFNDTRPITEDWLLSVFTDDSMNGVSVLIDGGKGHPVELFLLEDEENEGEFLASIRQSESDIIAITGRSFRTRVDVYVLFAALGYQPSVEVAAERN